MPNATSCGLASTRTAYLHTTSLPKPAYLRRHCTRPISALNEFLLFDDFLNVCEIGQIYCGFWFIAMGLFSTSTFPPTRAIRPMDAPRNAYIFVILPKKEITIRSVQFNLNVPLTSAENEGESEIQRCSLMKCKIKNLNGEKKKNAILSVSEQRTE